MPTRNLKRRAVKSEFTGESLTRQSEFSKSDINQIVKRGVLPPDPNQLQFGDFSTGFDFQAAQDSIARVNEQFDGLPSEIRYSFRNDPKNLLDFLANPENDEQAIKMGLKNAPEQNAPEQESKPKPKSKPSSQVPEPDLKSDASES